MFVGGHFFYLVLMFIFVGTYVMSFICLCGVKIQVLLVQFEFGEFLEVLVQYKVQLSYAVSVMIF